ncbi:MAG: cation diffusion facilitator family transporter [Lentisphaeria bacterium]|nr:cation diffusion facilitator family transporter [Lentisphaeria bacterium]
MEVKKTIAEMPVEQRDKVIVRTSVVGIAANVMLAAFKAAVGMAANSIAVVLDAVNNLSDALSSVITIVGTKLAGKQPDKKHPLGYGRMEYLSAMLVAGIVLYAGITSGVESVKKMLRPEKPEYGVLSLAIIAVAVIVKVVLGRYVKAQGEKVNSGSLVASGSDAMFDAVLSFSVLICAIVFMTTGISLEAYVGGVISCFIIKAGVEMMAETVGDILGRRADKETADKVRRILSEAPQVKGAHDLFLYNFGPDRNYGSVHLELPDTMTVEEVDRLTRKVEVKVFRETGVILTGVGVYSQNTGDGEAARILEDVREKVMAHEWALGFHGFHLDAESMEMRFDVVMSFDIAAKEGVRILQEEMKPLYPGYAILIVPDVDVSVSE